LIREDTGRSLEWFAAQRKSGKEINLIECRRETAREKTAKVHSSHGANAAELTITRVFPVQIKRRGFEMRLVIQGSRASAPLVDPALMQAITRGRQWADDLFDRAREAGAHLKLPYRPGVGAVRPQQSLLCRGDMGSGLRIRAILPMDLAKLRADRLWRNRA
jgi:hypothetical protein